MSFSRSPSQKINTQHGDGTFVTGNCATCDSTVRWPRHLGVYRCTVCLMVNDLRPATKREGGPSTENYALLASSIAPEPSPNSKSLDSAPSISLEMTRALVEQSIGIFLSQRLEHREEYSESVSPIKSDVQEGQQYYAEWTHGPAHGGNHPHFKNRPRAEPIRSSNLPHRSIDKRVPTPSNTTDSQDRPAAKGMTSLPKETLAPIATRQSGLDRQHSRGEIKDTKSEARRVFRPLEDYLIACLHDCDILNSAFVLTGPKQSLRASSEASTLAERPKKLGYVESTDDPPFEVDAKTLLLGDIGENGAWWLGGRRTSEKRAGRDLNSSTLGDRKSLRLDWPSIQQWYDLLLTCGRTWRSQRQKLAPEERLFLEQPLEERLVEEMLGEARYHLQRTFLKAIENVLRRPGRPLKTITDCRFLLILLFNPLLYPNALTQNVHEYPITVVNEWGKNVDSALEAGSYRSSFQNDQVSRGGATGRHSGLIKRILGLIANLPGDCHQSIVSWLSRLPEHQFREMVDLVGGFVSYRLSRQTSRKRHESHDVTAGLIPQISGLGAGSSAQLHAALDMSRLQQSKQINERVVTYLDDWQIRVAAKVMSLLFTANNSIKHFRPEIAKATGGGITGKRNLAARERAHRHLQILPTSTFYNTLLDYADLVTDFETWESRRGKFSFCQYPMFLSIWAKIRIMEHDAHRQMEVKARDAFFTSILSRKAVNQFFVLKVRRDCLVDDSLRSVSEVVGTGQEEFKKGLRIEFLGEEGVDAGGLRKEWFLLLVREVFDPDHGLFVYDEDSHYCYFNPNSFETSDQFFLVGVVLGLAIYNSTILDVALPPFAFRKLLASAPSYTGPSTTAIRPSHIYSLEDLAEWKPSLAKGLRQLLEHEGDVENTFCRDFVADVERYGKVMQVPLCPDGENIPVTNSNRREFVDLYIKYMLDSSVVRQYEPFKRGFFTICGGNALSLFRPEEIELLIRGSDEPLDTASLRAVAVYENWPQSEYGRETRQASEACNEPLVVQWFWELLSGGDIKSQRQILAFITGSDRIPAMGATSLVIKIVCLTDDNQRYPVARTCFNMLGLHQYRKKAELQSKLWRAITDSEGFGLK